MSASGLLKGRVALRLIFGAWLALAVPCLALAAGPKPYVRDAFDHADFVPHVYEESEIVRRYGDGQMVSGDGEIRRSYFDPASSLQVTMSGDADVASAYRTMDEILVSVPEKYPAGTPGIESLAGVALRGVRIGDAQAKVERLARSHPGLESVPAMLSDKPARRITFLASEEDLVYYRFYCRQGRVVAIAIGVTE